MAADCMASATPVRFIALLKEISSNQLEGGRERRTSKHIMEDIFMNCEIKMTLVGQASLGCPSKSRLPIFGYRPTIDLPILVKETPTVEGAGILDVSLSGVNM